MVVGPWVVIYAIVDFLIRVSSAFCAKLPNRPLVAMFVVEKFDEL